MICKACGFDDDKVKEKDGFIRIESSHDFFVIEGNSCPYHPSYKEDVTLHACPSCGTVRIKYWKLDSK